MSLFTIPFEDATLEQRQALSKNVVETVADFYGFHPENVQVSDAELMANRTREAFLSLHRTRVDNVLEFRRKSHEVA